MLNRPTPRRLRAGGGGGGGPIPGYGLKFLFSEQRSRSRCPTNMRFSSLDVYPKTLKEFRQRTTSGAIVSLSCATLIALLTCVEVADFLRGTSDDHLFVDTSRGSTLRINLNISFPALPCSTITLDTLDISGNHAPDLMRHISKTRLDKAGRSLEDGPRAGDGRPGRALLSGAGGGAQRGLGPALLQLNRNDLMLSALMQLLQPHVLEDKARAHSRRKRAREALATWTRPG